MDDGTFIGLNGNRQVFTPDNAKHIFVCGTTGSGKTVVLSNYIKRAVDCNYPLLLVDGKGEHWRGQYARHCAETQSAESQAIRH